jgi:S-adenosylmethionine hydrolase
MPSIVTLTTDFSDDFYVAGMKGAILSVNSDITIIDISHSVSPQNISEAAFIIGMAYRYFPEGTSHIVVVDPGVGSKRKALILSTPHALFVAPDNGVLSFIIDEYLPEKPPFSHSGESVTGRRKLPPGLSAVHITDSQFWRKEVSPTFHGRDVFAPVAAHLASGVPLRRFGKHIGYLNVFPITHPGIKDDEIVTGHVLYIDCFGNLITDIKVEVLRKCVLEVKIGNYCISGLNNYYAEKEGLIALTGSSGYLEIALTNGNASLFLEARTGDEVAVILQKESKTRTFLLNGD